MTANTDAFIELMTHVRETEALGQVAGRLGWDQETMMPQGAVEQRAEEHGAMANVLHARRTDPKIGEWLDRATAPDEVGAANLRHIRRSYDRTMKVPARLASELARTTSRAHRIWAQARADEDVAEMLTAFRDSSVPEFLARFGWAGVHAFTAWLLTAPLLAAAVYLPSRPLLRRAAARLSPASGAPAGA